MGDDAEYYIEQLEQEAWEEQARIELELYRTLHIFCYVTGDDIPEVIFDWSPRGGIDWLFKLHNIYNNIHIKDFNGILFRIFNASLENGGGIDYGFKISDPKHLAIREIIERAVLILIGKLYDVPFEQCEMPMPFEESIGGLVANNMTQKDQGYAQQVLEIVPTNEIAEWKNSDIQYQMLSTKTYEKDDGIPCREYYITAIRHNRKEGAEGTACRHKNGVWKDI
jgi:hypothetical protein